MDEKTKREQYDRSASIIDGEPETEEKQEAALPVKKSRWPIVLTAVLMVLVLVFGLLWAFDVIRFAGSDDPDPEADPQTQPTGSEPVDASLHLLPAARQGDRTVTLGMFAFDMEMRYQNIKSNYGSSLSTLGLDVNKSLKEQAAYQQEGTWFDFFVDRTEEDATWMLVMSRAAEEEGRSLTDKDKETVNTMLSNTDFSGMHNGVTEEDGRAYLEAYYLALEQEDAVFDSLSVTGEQVEAAYGENPRSYQVCDYAYFIYTYGEDADFPTKEAAAQAAVPTQEAATPEEFEKAVVDRLIVAGLYTDREEAADAYRQVCTKSGAAYREGDGYSDWLFDAATKPGDVKTLEEEGAIAVIMLTASPHRDESVTVDVRHILLNADNCGSDEAAAAKAEELLQQWRQGEATAESFGALAAEHTADGNGAQGGLYTGVTPGQMVTEFNDWCFDPTRKPGDSGVVKTQFGYHVMYFQAGHTAWYSAVEADLLESMYEPIYKELCEKYPVTFIDENIQKLEL